MNCSDARRILNDAAHAEMSIQDGQALDRHLGGCADCAMEWQAQEMLASMPVVKVPVNLKADIQHALLVSGKNSKRAGMRPTVVAGAVLLIGAAAAALLQVGFHEQEGGEAHVAAESDSAAIGIVPISDAGLGGLVPNSFTANSGDGGDTSTDPASTSVELFTVELTRLVPADQNQMGRQFGDWFHAALVEELNRVPNLILIAAPIDIEIRSIASDFRPEPEFVFDRDVSTWPADIDIRLAAGAGIENDGVGDRWRAVSAEGGSTGMSRDSSAMWPRDEAVPAYAARLAKDIVEDLKISLFPADASSLATQFAHFETIAADVSAEVSERSTALFAAEELARRANDPDITARLVDSILVLAAQIEDGLLNSSTFTRFSSQASAAEMDAARAQFAEAPAGILNMLSGMGDSRVIGPMSDLLLYDQNEATRHAAARILGEFADEPIARAVLESAAAGDASAKVRETANNYLVDDTVHLEEVLEVVRDSGLSDLERLSALLYGEVWQFVEPGFGVDSDTVDVVAELIERNDVDFRREALIALDWGGSPSFVPVYLERLRNDPSPEVRIDVLGILSEYRSMPDVDIALEDAAADDASEAVRAAAAKILEAQNP